MKVTKYEWKRVKCFHTEKDDKEHPSREELLVKLCDLSVHLEDIIRMVEERE